MHPRLSTILLTGKRQPVHTGTGCAPIPREGSDVKNGSPRSEWRPADHGQRAVTGMLSLILLVVGLMVGENLPDADQSTDLLLHRSIITHGPLVPALLIIVATIQWNPLRWFAIGVSLGLTVHLAFDLFPKGWAGYALISLPVYGWTPVVFSKVWIALSTVVCAYLAARLVSGRLEATLFVLGAIGIFIYAAPHEGALWRPALAVVTASIVAMLLSRRSHSNAGA